MDKISINIPNFDGIELDDDGTPIGTFKSVQTLKQAYDELRSCYTKNAMELAKLKEGQSSDKENTPDEVDKASAPTNVEAEDWENSLDNFFDQNPTAKQFGEEIINLVKQDKDIKTSNAPLLNAWIKVLEDKVQSNKMIDENVNPDMREKIIKDYLDTIKSHKSAPPVIISHEGVENITSPKQTIHTLDDAFNLAKKYFE